MRRIGYQSNDARQMSRPDLPWVEVSHPVAVPFKAVGHRRLNAFRLGSGIDRHPASGAQQTPRPAPYDKRAREANEQVHPHPFVAMAPARENAARA